MEYSFLSIDLQCPNCGFGIEVLMKQVIAEETILCLGCLQEIVLIDEGGSIRTAEQELDDSLEQLRRLLDNF